jgi:hypothetical protein
VSRVWEVEDVGANVAEALAAGTELAAGDDQRAGDAR